MKRFLRGLVFCCIACTAQARPLQPGRDYVEGEVIVTFKTTTDSNAATQALHSHGLAFVKRFDFLSKHRKKQLGLVRTRNRTTAELIAVLKNDPLIELVETNYLRHPSISTPNDSNFPLLWALRNTGQTVNGSPGTSGADIQFIAAWSLARPSSNQIVVAVIDSGVDYTHPDLAQNMWTNPGEIPSNGLDDDTNSYVNDYFGYDFADNDPDPAPSIAHGTHIAGTIAATGHNQLGMIGVNYQARIMALKVGSAANPNTFSDSAIIEAIEYVIMMKQRNVNIVAINASWGGPGFNATMRDAIATAGSLGIVFCAAAGNDSINIDVTPDYPSSYQLSNMIVVAASTQNDTMADFSNYGANTVDLAAPGVNILSTIPLNQGTTIALVQQSSTTYAANGMTFSGTATGITATIYDCGLGYSTNFPPAVSNNIALISRGTLFFYEKTANAMAAGARAAIIYNNTSGSLLGSLLFPSNWIPVVGISQADGLALQSALPTTVTVINTNDPVAIYGYLDGTSMATPHVVGAVAFAAMNFPNESVSQRIQRILTNVDVKVALQGSVTTGGRLNLQRTIDTDLNNLPDWWEKIYFGQLTGTDPAADPDHDGANNGQEWTADTIPTNALSVLRMISVTNNPGGLMATWQSVSSRSYFLERATNLGNTSLFQSVATNIAGIGGTTTYHDTTANSAGTYFYRVGVQP